MAFPVLENYGNEDLICRIKTIETLPEINYRPLEAYGDTRSIRSRTTSINFCYVFYKNSNNFLVKMNSGELAY